MRMTGSPPDEKRKQTRTGVLRGTLLVDGDGHAIVDWSRNGWRVRAAKPWSPIGAGFDLVLGIRSDVGSVEVRGRGTIVRAGDGDVAGTWDLRTPSDPATEALLDVFLSNGTNVI
jgi:hypothetical protein